jgi:hypothetical protein
MEDYAVSQIATDINEQDVNKIEASILAMFDQEFICLIRDNDDQAANYNNMARKIWNYYQLRVKGADIRRVGLKPLAQLQRFELRKLLDPQTGLPPEAVAILRTKLKMPEEAPAPAASTQPAAAGS